MACTKAFLLVTNFCLIFAKATKPRPLVTLVEDIKPVSDQLEDTSYWLEFGKNDLKNRLQIQTSTGIAKNVILFVGDGMGIQTGTMSRIYKGQKKGRKGEEDQLIWESFPFTGLSKTYNTDYQVADSAGTATAMVSGVKTRLGVIGIDNTMPRNSCDPEAFEKAKVKNMMHWAVEAGKDIGVVTSTRITHATPSATYAHSASRDWEHNNAEGFAGRNGCNEDIAKQLIHGEIGAKMKVIFGGGKRNFVLESEGGLRTDTNLIEEYGKLKKDMGASYRFLETSDDLKKWQYDGMTDYVLGLFGSSHLPYEADRNEGTTSPKLSEMASAAVEKLQNVDNDGFFLLVESGRIDHGHHENLAQKSMEEALEFDKTIEALMGMVDLEETLMVVTADHSHSVTINGYPIRGNDILGSYFSDPVTMSKYDDGSKLAYATISYANGPAYKDHFTGNVSVPWRDMRDLDFRDKDFKHPAMMPGPENYETHGGEDVGIFAIGPLSQLVVGVHEQSYIGHVIAYAACVGPYADDCPRPNVQNQASANDISLVLLLLSSVNAINFCY